MKEILIDLRAVYGLTGVVHSHDSVASTLLQVFQGTVHVMSSFDLHPQPSLSDDSESSFWHIIVHTSSLVIGSM